MSRGLSVVSSLPLARFVDFLPMMISQNKTDGLAKLELACMLRMLASLEGQK
jgi:hypothetical protein